ncbi:ferrochelatase [Gluconacetobacter azotocaptans]|uniref:Ferrochelatase n=1 Tax=Gluconacetobacter azotocaptans TaxID=142834 RepID=A0A7W4JQZ0_9PROT|nr:ferrochelatase [Gluconacetobacter azotocaptans]MBB2189157.1 ferrochelatase [Gluconacetobacter azotocaptans]MBM9402154.1 ferrochelatase [Gluconacetobacter azotocaptans]GBQ33053.1 ferrochelatase [Gluconacetobacter azotocaptans DSM 13594]
MSFLTIRPDAPATPGPSRIGVLLTNLGTPDGTGYQAIRRYLSEFLSDRRIIEASPAIWQPILQGPILTLRPRRTGAAYRRIWHAQRDESPLRTHTRAQAEGLAERLAADGVAVEWAMRYGNPAILSGIDRLLRRGCDRILLLPLYPQYSATTTATANDQAFRALMRLRNQPAIRTVPPFPDHPLYIDALARSVRETLADLPFAPQRIVASFHGLPRDYVARGDHYPQDCERTIAALRRALDMDEATMPLTYQSRFGPARWLEPYTAPLVRALPAQGVTRVAVIMPGFMADCIETLDEIGNEVRAEFIAAGGTDFALIPCLNGAPAAIDLLEALARRELAGWLDPA